MYLRVTVAGVFVLAIVLAAPPFTTYDQRQEGEMNVHAHLENFVIVLIPSSGLSLLDIANLASKNVRGKPYYHHPFPFRYHHGKIPHVDEVIHEEPRLEHHQKPVKTHEVVFEHSAEGVKPKSPYNIDIDAAKHSLSRLHPPKFDAPSDNSAVVIAHSPSVSLSKSGQRINDKTPENVIIVEKNDEDNSVNENSEDDSDEKKKEDHVKEENETEDKGSTTEYVPIAVAEPRPIPASLIKTEASANEEPKAENDKSTPVKEINYAGEKFRIPIKVEENKEAEIPVEVVQDNKSDKVEEVKESTIDLVHEGIKVSIIPTEEQKSPQESESAAEGDSEDLPKVTSLEKENSKSGKHLDGSAAVLTPDVWKASEEERKRVKLLGGGIEECLPGQRRDVNGRCENVRSKHRSLLAALRFGLSPAGSI